MTYTEIPAKLFEHMKLKTLYLDDVYEIDELHPIPTLENLSIFINPISFSISDFPNLKYLHIGPIESIRDLENLNQLDELCIFNKFDPSILKNTHFKKLGILHLMEDELKAVIPEMKNVVIYSETDEMGGCEEII